MSATGCFGIGTSRRHGCDLFAGFKRMHLTTQQRATTDLQHTAFINKLSTGRSITREDLNNYKKLTKSDIDDNPDRWKYAPILVASNRERINIVQRKAALFAQDFDTHIIKWPSEAISWRNKPADVLRTAEITDSDPCFWEYFVPGAEAFLTHNVNNELGLANGTAVKLHSLTFADSQQLQYVTNLIKNSTPGSEIILLKPPLAVNVLIPSSPASNTSSKKRAQLKILKDELSLPGHDDEIIIPLPQDKKNCKWQHYTVQGHNVVSVGKVQTRPTFTFELAFAMTVHKAQGRTISRVVLALSMHPLHTSRMSYASIFVAMTRVRHRNHLRLLYHNNGYNTGDMGVEYITRLRPDPDVLDYYAGFTNSSGYWQPTRSLLSKRNRPLL